ncbi:MAG TPA: beta-propeller fold lactonase family protein [Kofleriaceae bacterium]|nr:beta-propeller fold lactonase family protein [Kofleriaceae bacterium]
MHRFSRNPRWAVAALGLSLGLIASCAGDEPKRSFIYTVRNGAANAVHGFEVAADGSLSELPGSPYLDGGGGLTHAAIISDHSIVTDDDGRHLFVVNPTTSDISVFDIGLDGRLHDVVGSPFPSGSKGNPVSLAISDDILYASFNSSSFTACVGCGYRGFRIAQSGALTPIDGAAIDLPEAPVSFPVSLSFNPAGDLLVALRFSLTLDAPNANVVETFALDRKTGLLQAAPGSPVETGQANTQPLAAAFNPANPQQLFVGSAVNIPRVGGAVAMYSITSAGAVALMPGSPVPSGEQKGTAWVAATNTGRQLYASNTFSDSISRFTVTPAGEITLDEVVPDLPDETGEAPRAIVITHDDRYLYVINGHGGVDGNGGSLVGFALGTDGALTRLAFDPPRFVGEQPFGLVNVRR